MEAMIVALVIVVGFGISLLVMFHYDDKRKARLSMEE